MRTAFTYARIIPQRPLFTHKSSWNMQRLKSIKHMESKQHKHTQTKSLEHDPSRTTNGIKPTRFETGKQKMTNRLNNACTYNDGNMEL